MRVRVRAASVHADVWHVVTGLPYVIRLASGTPAAFEEELVRLARNEAVRMGGNVVSPLSMAVDGEQDFTIYRCP